MRKQIIKLQLSFHNFYRKKGWHHMLHNQSSLLIRTSLLFHKNVVIMTVPFHLSK